MPASVKQYVHGQHLEALDTSNPFGTKTRYHALGHPGQTLPPGHLHQTLCPGASTPHYHWGTQTRLCPGASTPDYALGHSNQTLCPRSPTSHPEALIHPEAPTPDCPVVPTPDYAYSTHTTALGHHTTLCPEAPTPDTMPCGTHITSHSVAHQTLPWSPTPD